MSTSLDDTPLYLSNPVKPAMRSPHYVPFTDIETLPPPPPSSSSTSGLPPLTPFPHFQTTPQQLLPPQAVDMSAPPPPLQLQAAALPQSFGPRNVLVSCPYCHCEIQTSIEKKPSLIAWISVGVIALCGGIFGCCLIPLCMDSCMDTFHNCPTCGARLGKHPGLDF